MPELITKQCQRPMLIKAMDSDVGSITAYVTTYNDPDCVGDIILPGALDKFIKNFKDSLPMLWMHNREEIIGEWTHFESDKSGVIGTGNIFEGVSRSSDVRVYLAKQIVNAVSLGFTSSDHDYDGETGAVTFNEIDIREISLVVDPCNENAQILSAKDADGKMNFRQIEATLRDAGLSRREAKCLIANGRTGLRDAEKTTDPCAIVDEFLKLMKEGYNHV